MLRIAIGTLAVTMLVGPLLAIGGAAPHREAAMVSQDQALALAKAQGLARLTNVVFEGGIWIVRGANRDGSPLEVDVSSAGEVLNPAL